VVEVFWTDPDAALVQRARPAGPALVAWQVAGEGVGDVREVRPAAAIVADLVANLG
jgi:hypothetical protein